MRTLLQVLLLFVLNKAAGGNINITTSRELQATGRPQIAVYYYAWWNNPSNPHWTDGYLREFLQTPQEPLQGEYFYQDQTALDQHLQWMKQYGINQIIASWFGPNRFGDTSIQDFLFTAADKLAQSDTIKICLFYESRGRLERDFSDNGRIYFDNSVNDNEQQLKDDFDYLATNYFGRSNYLFTSDGKAVVYIYLTRTFRGDIAEAFSNLRTHVRNTHGYELYLVADELYWGAPEASRIGIYDAITSYNMHGPSRFEGYPDDTDWFSEIDRKYEQWRTAANDIGVAVIPNAMPAYNDRGVRLGNDNYAIPHEINAGLSGSGQYTTFQKSLEVAYEILETQTSDGIDDPPTIAITSWNEWNEDTNIEPSAGTAGSSNNPSTYTQGYTYTDYGFGLLDVLQDFLQPFPTPSPTPLPTPNPTPMPTGKPTAWPTPHPTPNPTPSPTPMPTPNPTANPTPFPTPNPTPFPTGKPAIVPSPVQQHTLHLIEHQCLLYSYPIS